jgi:excinuclease UvrABC nuclease subunit
MTEEQRMRRRIARRLARLPKPRKPDGAWSFVPAGAGVFSYVYVAYDLQGRVVYVGLSDNVLGRLGEHSRYKGWWRGVAKVEFWEFDNRAEAARYEQAMIATHQPPGNTMGVDWRMPWAVA